MGISRAGYLLPLLGASEHLQYYRRLPLPSATPLLCEDFPPLNDSGMRPRYSRVLTAIESQSSDNTEYSRKSLAVARVSKVVKAEVREKRDQTEWISEALKTFGKSSRVGKGYDRSCLLTRCKSPPFPRGKSELLRTLLRTSITPGFPIPPLPLLHLPRKRLLPW